jgi:hypothetical protein
MICAQNIEICIGKEEENQKEKGKLVRVVVDAKSSDSNTDAFLQLHNMSVSRQHDMVYITGDGHLDPTELAIFSRNQDEYISNKNNKP